MIIKYQIAQDIYARKAILLNQALEQLPGYVLIRFEDKNINGKSLIGLLSAKIKKGDIITISYDDNNSIAHLIEIVNQFGKQV